MSSILDDLQKENEIKFSSFQNDISNYRTFKQKISSIFEHEFSKSFEDILLQKKEKFLLSVISKIKTILTTLYTNKIFENSNFSEIFSTHKKYLYNDYDNYYNSLQKQLNYYTEQKKNLSKAIIQKNFYITKHRKHCAYTSEYAIHKCSNIKCDFGKFIIVPNINDENEILYVICENCQKCYFYSQFLCFCEKCNFSYYTNILTPKEISTTNPHLLRAALINNHCNNIADGKLICIKCNVSCLYLNMNTNLLECINPACEFKSKSIDIEWECITCKQKFKSEAKVYNPLDRKILRKEVLYALCIKMKARPSKLPCCTKKNIFMMDFFHKKECNGILYIGEYNNKKIVICEKCQAINDKEKFIWTCPECGCKFKNPKTENRKLLEKNRGKSEIFSNLDSCITYRENFQNKEEKNFKQYNLLELIRKRKNFPKSSDRKNINNNKENIDIGNIHNKEKINNENYSNENSNTKESGNKKYNKCKKLNIPLPNPKDRGPICNLNSQFKKQKIIFNKKLNQKQNANSSIRNKSQSLCENKTDSVINLKKSGSFAININNDKNKSPINNKNDKSDNSDTSRGASSNRYRYKKLCRPYEKNEKLEKIEITKENNINKKIDPIKFNVVSIIKRKNTEQEKNIICETQYNIMNKNEIINKNSIEKFKNRTPFKQRGYLNLLNLSQLKLINSNKNIKNFIFYNDYNNSKDNSSNKNYYKDPKINSSDKLKKRKIFVRDRSSLPNINISTNLDLIKKLNKPNDVIEISRFEDLNDIPIKNESIINNKKLYDKIQKSLKRILDKGKLPQFQIENYRILKELGEGAFGVIYEVINKTSKIKYAIKKIIANNLKTLQIKQREFELVHQSAHKYILDIYGICLRCLDSTTYVLYVLMDLAKCDWEAEINRRAKIKKYYTEKELITILKNLVTALEFLQSSKNIAHRDIKPENILIFSDDLYKVADFGEAKKIEERRRFKTVRGTDYYMSPLLYESVLNNKDDVKHNVYKSDVFSLGYCFICAAALNFDIICNVRSLKYSNEIRRFLTKIFFKRYSDNFIDVIISMVEYEESKRVDFIELKKILEKF